MDLQEFIAKWSVSELKESSASHEHFIDLCNLLGEETPAAADPDGSHYCFEKGVHKTLGGKGWADVWKRGHFAWEYKGPHKNLGKALEQLRQYAAALENPPLLIVSDMKRFEIHTSWTNIATQTHSFALEQLADGKNLDILRWAFSDPNQLMPGTTRHELTEKAATTFAELAHKMRRRGHEPQEVAHFVIRLIFCMFAEDVGLLDRNLFTSILESARKKPEYFVGMAKELFGAMASGGRFGYYDVNWFNGGLFGDDSVLSMKLDEIETTLKAAELDWSEVDPAIMGTLFERGLDPSKRRQLGAHYTDHEKIMRIIEPVIDRPLLREWESRKQKIEQCLEKAGKVKTTRAKGNWQRKAENILQAYLDELRGFTVLDPACGSGNFLYLALRKLKDIEHQVQIEAESLGLPRQFPGVGPANVKGIEINPYAAKLANVSVWIGEIQWMRQNGFGWRDDPILQPLKTIECKDAILGKEGAEPEWPKADVVIGNPPFLGGKLLRRELGGSYVKSLQRLYGARIHGEADLVCHWFDKANRLITDGKIKRVGLVATNSIRGGRNRFVLDRIVENGTIYDAWSDEPWVVDGAAVRVSLVCFANQGADLDISLDGEKVPKINAGLTSDRNDLTKAGQISRNSGATFMGVTKAGPFDISGDLAREWLSLPANPNGRKNSDVLSPWLNGKDVVNRPSGDWIIDFGSQIDEREAAFFEAPFAYLEKNSKPIRQLSSNEKDRKYWWRHTRSRPQMRKAISGLSRYIVTPTTSKHRIFVWVAAGVCPENALIVVAREDDTTFGILHSRFHESWSLRLCTWLGQGNDPRYTPTTTFQTFPFPAGLTPDIPAPEYAYDSRAIKIADAAKRLVEQRDNWINPPDLVEWVDEPVTGYPKRPVARSEAAAEVLKDRTLTNLYNSRPQWLQNAHADLDEAVASAYGWPADISTEDALAELLEMNLSNST